MSAKFWDRAAGVTLFLGVILFWVAVVVSIVGGPWLFCWGAFAVAGVTFLFSVNEWGEIEERETGRRAPAVDPVLAHWDERLQWLSHDRVLETLPSHVAREFNVCRGASRHECRLVGYVENFGSLNPIREIHQCCHCGKTR